MRSIFSPFLAVVLSVASVSATVTVTTLRCEYAENPVGIDSPQPRLGWVLESKQRAQRQTAYQVLVATSDELLKPGKADLWDTGKVVSDQSIQLAYAGKPLASRQRCFWKVRVWDQDGKMSESAPAQWEMGLLERADWQAQWIGFNSLGAQDKSILGGAPWIWFPEGNPAADAPQGERFFRRLIALPADASQNAPNSRSRWTINLRCSSMGRRSARAAARSMPGKSPKPLISSHPCAPARMFSP